MNLKPASLSFALDELTLNELKELKIAIDDKIKHTYVRMNDRYKDCKYQYSGWVK